MLERIRELARRVPRDVLLTVLTVAILFGAIARAHRPLKPGPIVPVPDYHVRLGAGSTTAKFKVNGTASSPPGFDATTSQVITLQLETAIAPDVYKTQFFINDPNDPTSPQASLSAPQITLSPSNGIPATPTGTVTFTMPASGVHSYSVRCVINNGVEAATGKVRTDWTYERIVGIRSLTSLIRKILPAESTQYSPRGWADEQNRMVDSFNGGGPPSGSASGDLTGSYPAPLAKQLTGVSGTGITGLTENITTVFSPELLFSGSLGTTQIGQKSTNVTAADLHIRAQSTSSGVGGGLFLHSGDGTTDTNGVQILGHTTGGADQVITQYFVEGPTTAKQTCGGAEITNLFTFESPAAGIFQMRADVGNIYLDAIQKIHLRAAQSTIGDRVRATAGPNGLRIANDATAPTNRLEVAGVTSLTGNTDAVQLVVAANSTQTTHLVDFKGTAGTVTGTIRQDGTGTFPKVRLSTDLAAPTDQLEIGGNNASWDAAITAATLYQKDNTTNGATASPLTVRSANATGTLADAGKLILATGTSTDPAVTSRPAILLKQGATMLASFSQKTGAQAMYLGIADGSETSTNYAVSTDGVNNYFGGLTSGLYFQAAGGTYIMRMTTTGVRIGDSTNPTDQLELVGNNMSWVNTATPKIYQKDFTTNSATAPTFTAQAANATGTNATGGTWKTKSGTGTGSGAPGNIQEDIATAVGAAHGKWFVSENGTEILHIDIGAGVPRIAGNGDLDMTSSGFITLDSTNGTIIRDSGGVNTLFQVAPSAITFAVTPVQFSATLSTPIIKQADRSAAGAATSLTIAAQSSVASATIGGDLKLASGTGNAGLGQPSGKVTLATGPVNALILDPQADTMTSENTNWRWAADVSLPSFGQAQAASGNSGTAMLFFAQAGNGTNKAGGSIIMRGGQPTGTGISGATSIATVDNAGSFSYLLQVASLTSGGRRVVALGGAATVTTTDVPSGDGMTFLAGVATGPTSRPGTGALVYSKGGMPTVWGSNTNSVEVQWENNVATSASAGTNGAVPAQVDEYLTVFVNGNARKIPLFHAVAVDPIEGMPANDNAAADVCESNVRCAGWR